MESKLETMTIKEICKVLKISPASGRNRIAQKLPMPPSFKVGRSRLFLVSEFNRWMEEQTKADKEELCEEKGE